jgi:hypothetical protein
MLLKVAAQSSRMDRLYVELTVVGGGCGTKNIIGQSQKSASDRLGKF